MISRLRWVLPTLIALLALVVPPQASLARPSAAITTTFVRAGNVRAQPSTDSQIVTGLAAGSAVSASARAGDWARITVVRTGVRGWAIRSLLALSATQFASLPAQGGGTTGGTTPPPSGPVAGVGGTTILLAGVDRRPGERTTRADALLLLRVDPRAGSVSVLSIPRDLYVPVPGYGSMKINNGYLYGGLALQKRTVSQYFGVRVDYGVAINFGGFAGLIDAIGGITVNVPRRLIDNAYPTENYGTMRVVFEPGVQRMNGARALIYSRTRHPDSDFGRMGRQQQVLVAIARQIQAIGATGTLARAGNIASLLSNYVVTDMPVSAMASTLWNGRGTGGNVRTFMIDLNYCRPATVGGAYVLIPYKGAINNLVARWAGR